MVLEGGLGLEGGLWFWRVVYGFGGRFMVLKGGYGFERWFA